MYLVDENGDRQPIEDGDYVLEDGRTVVVKDSKVEEIKEKAEEVVEEPTQVPTTEETNVEENEEPTDTEVENPDGTEEKDNTAIEELRKEVNELYDLVDKLTKRIEELENKPAAKPVQEDFKNVNQIEKTGNKAIDTLSRRLGLNK